MDIYCEAKGVLPSIQMAYSVLMTDMKTLNIYSVDLPCLLVNEDLISGSDFIFAR